MSALIFLAVVVGISVLGSAIAWYRAHERETLDSSIDDFRSEMSALDPDETSRPPGRRKRR